MGHRREVVIGQTVLGRPIEAVHFTPPDYAKPRPDPLSSGAQWGVTVYSPPPPAKRTFLDEERARTAPLGPGSAHPCTTGEVRLELEGFLLAGDPHACGIIWDLAVDESKGELYVLADTRPVRGVAEVRVFDRRGGICGRSCR